MIRLRTFEVMQAESLNFPEAEEKAINQVASKGNFFDFKSKRYGDSYGRYLDHIERSTRRSWHRYPAKRRSKISQGKYLQADERLVGFAAASLFLLGERTCLLTNDTDYEAILKQFTDNVAWVASVIDCGLSLGYTALQLVGNLWEGRCRYLNQFREKENHQILQRLQQLFEDESANPCEALLPSENELLVCRPNDGLVRRYQFSEAFFAFVKGFKAIFHQLSHTREIAGKDREQKGSEIDSLILSLLASPFNPTQFTPPAPSSSHQ